MIPVTSPFNRHHAVTLTLTSDLLQGQSCCRVGDHNSPTLLVTLHMHKCSQFIDLIDLVDIQNNFKSRVLQTGTFTKIKSFHNYSVFRASPSTYLAQMMRQTKQKQYADILFLWYKPVCNSYSSTPDTDNRFIVRVIVILCFLHQVPISGV